MGRDHGRRAEGRRSERGVILIWASFTTVLVAGVITTALYSDRALDELTRIEYAKNVQADAVARAGLVDALAWFRRQPSQPVTAFAPALDLDARTPVNETDDPSIGIVRAYEVSPGFWGRYEVRIATPAEPYVDSDGDGRYGAGDPFTDVDGNGKWSPTSGTQDVSEERGLTGQGWAWHLQSVGTVYRVSDESQPLGSAANPRIASRELSTEIRRLAVSLPADAAINARTGGLVQLKSGSRVTSPTTGVAVGTAAVRISVSPYADVQAPVKSVNVPHYKDELYDVFGSTWDDLKSMSDLSLTSVDGFDGTLPPYSVVTVDGDLTFDASRPLLGLGLLIVRGNVTITSGSNSYFRGVLYVDGNVELEAPSIVRGTILATGYVRVGGVGSDTTTVEHDPDLVKDILARIGQYRYSKAVYPTPRYLSDGTAAEDTPPPSPGGGSSGGSSGGSGGHGHHGG